MKMIKNHKIHWKKIAQYTPAVLATGLSSYAAVELVTSGLVPQKYSIPFILVVILLIFLSLFLTWKRFKSKKATVAARITAVVLSLILIFSSIGGLYVLNRSLGVLNKISRGVKTVKVDTNKSFNIFISGIDTYGDISTQSRSDVNIVATVNPKTRNILLTTIPRDSYVKIALGGNDQYDKLTHAGNYGVESSKQTVANLLDVKIDTYIRINFSSFTKIVDALGGVTVHNPTAFSSYGEHFDAGDIYLTGNRALVYSRERKNLTAGDIDRGKNQQRVIQGIVDKISGIRSVSGFNALLDTIGNSIQTNLDDGTIKQLINQQIDNTTAWTTKDYSLEGKGQTGGLKSYAMPNAQLYMYVLNQDSINQAKAQIDEAMNK